MNLKEERYSKFALVREMMETVDVVARFDSAQMVQVAQEIKTVGRLMLTGEGSSRRRAEQAAAQRALEVLVERGYDR